MQVKKAPASGAFYLSRKGASLVTQERCAFDGVIADPLAGRSVKPRTAGQTMVIDKGLGLSQTGDLLQLAAPYIDYMKSCTNWVPK